MPIKQQSLTDIVHSKLQKAIVTGRFSLGQPLVENDLALEFNISKTPVREALLRLKNEGLVVVRPRSGTFVFQFTAEEVNSLGQMRTILELGALRVAFAANHLHLIKGLSRNLADAHELLRQRRINDYLASDQDFHAIIINSARNPYIENAYKHIFSKISALRHRLVFDFGFVETSLNSHSLILEFITNDALEKACNRLEQHISNTFTEETISLLTKTGA